MINRETAGGPEIDVEGEMRKLRQKAKEGEETGETREEIEERLWAESGRLATLRDNAQTNAEKTGKYDAIDGRQIDALDESVRDLQNKLANFDRESRKK